MTKKTTLTVTTPHGVFSRTTATPYTHAVVSLAVSRTTGFDGNGNRIVTEWETAEQFKAWIGDDKVGVFGRFAKDGGYVVSYHSSEAAARKAAEKGNSPYVTTRTLGVFPVDARTGERV
jgi:hypothetical protein